MKSVKSRFIELHQQAPPKPLPGAPCNRCGVCCAAEPCPVAHVFLLQLTGRCRALLWQEAQSRYACGMVVEPHRYSWLVPKIFSAALGAFFAGRIAAGKGCDAQIEVSE
jgi:hypothetical protein